MHYEVKYNGNKETFNSIFKALHFFKEIKNASTKELTLVEEVGRKEIFLLKGVYVGHGTNFFTNGYKIYENGEKLYDLKIEESNFLGSRATA